MDKNKKAFAKNIKIRCLFDEMVALKNLKPHPENPNKHPDEQIVRLAEILEYQGWRYPIKVSMLSGFITSGHGRLLAARKLGLKKVPVNFQEYDSDEQEYADVTADNAIALWAELDLAAINAKLPDLGPEFNIDTLGIKDFILEPAEKVALCDEDEIPNSPPAITKEGDLYQLGDHRLLCGDSTNVQNVKKLMDGAKPNILMSDPPYGVELDQTWRDEALGTKALGKGNRNLVSNDNRADWTDVWTLFPGNVSYIWHAAKFSDIVMKSLRDADLEPSQQLIWNKSIMIMGRSDYHFKHEPCWYSIRKGKAHDWIGDRKQVTVIDAAPPNHIMGGSKEEKTVHPTQKPLACMELITNNSGDVYYPFGGSGTTLIACEKHNRKCFMMELDPHYCDVIISRWEKYTGKKAVLSLQEVV